MPPQPLRLAAVGVAAALHCSQADAEEAAGGHRPGTEAAAEPLEVHGWSYPETAQAAAHEQSGSSAEAAQAAERRRPTRPAVRAAPVQYVAYEAPPAHSSSRSRFAEGSAARPRAPDSMHSQTPTAPAEGDCAVGAQLSGLLCHWSALSDSFVPKSHG